MTHPKHITLKLFISSIFCTFFFSASLFAQSNSDSILVRSADSILVKNDTTTALKIDSVKVKEKHFQYFRVGVDVSKIIRSSLTNKYSTFEFLAEGIWKSNLHYVAEGGFATANTFGDNVSFTSTSYFTRIGFDKYFFGSLYKGDLDNAFIGARFGWAHHDRAEATATLWDPFYGNTIITMPPASQNLYWISLTGGFRMEVIKNVFLGWNIRGKFFLNPRTFQELTPEYLAGYGAAKKQPVFDYNLYLLYGFGKR